MERKLGIIIQARTSSTRLPEKILMPVGDKPMILFLYNRLNDYFDIPIIVATTDNSQDDHLAEMLVNLDIKIYRGSEDNVVTRFIGAAKYYGFTDIVRVCADSPLLDLYFLDELIKVWKDDTESDYISFEFNEKPVILSHFGVFAEVVKLSALEKVASLFPGNSIYLEHITNGVYMNPGIFKIRMLNLDRELTPFDGIRLTIDTKEDFERISALMPKIKNIKFEEIANYIKSQPELLLGMKQTILENSK